MNPLFVLEKYWKPLTIITLAFLVFSIIVLVNHSLATGYFMDRDVDLNGGKEVMVKVRDVDISKVREALPFASVKTTSGIDRTLAVEFSIDIDENEVINTLRSVVQFDGEPSVRVVGPAVANSFLQNAQIAILVAFLLMAITVFVLFRSAVPSLIVIIAAATDIIGTMAVLNILGIPLSLPVLVALLTLIGYSVDTDIVLTNELLKTRHSSFMDGLKTAMKTGLTLTATTLAALIAMLLFSGSIVIEQIATVLLIGLIIDVPATWLTNAGVLRWWISRSKTSQTSRGK